MANKRLSLTEIYHLPEASKAYYERTPQNILSQYEFRELFQSKGALENLRRAEGIVKVAQKEIAIDPARISIRLLNK